MSCTIVHTQDHIDENFVPRIHIVPYKLFGKHPRKRPLDIELHMLKHKLEHMLELKLPKNYSLNTIPAMSRTFRDRFFFVFWSWKKTKKKESPTDLDDNTVEYIADHMEGYNCSWQLVEPLELVLYRKVVGMKRHNLNSQLCIGILWQFN